MENKYNVVLKYTGYDELRRGHDNIEIKDVIDNILKQNFSNKFNNARFNCFQNLLKRLDFSCETFEIESINTEIINITKITFYLFIKGHSIYFKSDPIKIINDFIDYLLL